MRYELIWGIHVIQSLLSTSPERILELYILESRKDQRIDALKELAKQSGVALHSVSKKYFQSLGLEVVHQGVVAKIRPQVVRTEHDLMEIIKDSFEKKATPPLLLVLDHLEDPHNLGACLRTADAAGVQAVIIPKSGAVNITPGVRKSASGAAETVPCFEVSNLVRCLEALKKEGIWIIGATGNTTQTIFEADLRGPIALVLGSENKGLRRLTAESCDILVRIPMVGTVESLNVSVAAGICLYEAFRQRMP